MLAKLNKSPRSTRPKTNGKTGKAVSSGAKVTSALTLWNGATYLFYSNGTYARTSRGRNGFDRGYPAKMPGGWKGLPKFWNKDIDAAVAFQGSNKSYMFKSGQYVRLNKVKVDKGYPARMPGGWKNIPRSWRGDVDAAIYFPANRKHYFFKGNQYVRLTGTKVDKGYPSRLPGGWRGMPADFARGIDAATTRAGHVYMIKGDKYIRFVLDDDGSGVTLTCLETDESVSATNAEIDSNGDASPLPVSQYAGLGVAHLADFDFVDRFLLA